MAKSLNHEIKEIQERLYHLILDDIKTCHFCGENFIKLIEQHKIPINSHLILETVPEYCSIACSDIFLNTIKHFKSVAYVLTKETNKHNPWIHAFVVRNNNKNTQFFNSYEDAYNWSATQV